MKNYPPRKEYLTEIIKERSSYLSNENKELFAKRDELEDILGISGNTMALLPDADLNQIYDVYREEGPRAALKKMQASLIEQSKNLPNPEKMLTSAVESIEQSLGENLSNPEKILASAIEGYAKEMYKQIDERNKEMNEKSEDPFDKINKMFEMSKSGKLGKPTIGKNQPGDDGAI